MTGRARSASESQFPGIGAGPGVGVRHGRRPTASSSLTALTTANAFPGRERDNSRAALTRVLRDHKFSGIIVTIKPDEEYGFLRSQQISEDIFFSTRHLPTGNTGIVGPGALVTFSVRDVGKKSMEARNIEIVTKSEVKFLTGRVMEWLKKGCLVQVTSGLGVNYLHNRIFAPKQETKSIPEGVVGTEVQFQVHMDSSFRVEARDVWRVASAETKEVSNKAESRVRAKSEGDNTSAPEVHGEEGSPSYNLVMMKHFTTEEFSQELIKSIELMDSVRLSELFNEKLKTNLAVLANQPIGSNVVLAIIKRVSRIEAENVEAKIARILAAKFSSICSCKPGCQVLQAGLERFQPGNAVMLAERVAELDTVEQLLALWQHGSNL